MKFQNLAIISPRDDQVVEVNRNSNGMSTAPTVRMREKDVSLSGYLSRYPDSKFIPNDSKEQQVQTLEESKENSRTLDFALMMFDNELSHQVRRKIANELQALFSNPKRMSYVYDIMLAAPLDDAVDTIGGLKASQDHQLVRNFISTVTESQSRVEKVFLAWLSIRSETMIEQAGVNWVRGRLLDAGVFRRLVLECSTKAELGARKASIVLDANEFCDARIINKLIEQYASDLPQGEPVRKATRNHSTFEQPNEGKGFEDTLNDDAKIDFSQIRQQKDRAISEVGTISELYSQGKDERAGKFRAELVERQTIDNQDHSHVVKSLSNIASKCTTTGRRDIAASCLDQALTFENGIDDRLYAQMGKLFRGLRKFPEALDCFEKAKSLAFGDHSREKINLEITRVAVAQGLYDSALQAFQELPDIKSSASPRCSLATLHRKMGNLRCARNTYEDVLHLEPTYHQAMAGLAECNKQSGKYVKAKRRYQKLLVSPELLDDQSYKIYRLSLSFLLRLTNDLNGANGLLNELNLQYPKDPNVNLQISKVAMLQGDAARAKDFFHKSFEYSHSLDLHAAKLFATAFGQSLDLAIELPEPELTMPEQRGLTNCDLALSAIMVDNCDDVQSSIQLGHVDRLHDDFASVLLFHAQKRNNPGWNTKSNVAINRIRKRGLRDLRDSVLAIDRDDFESALVAERRMCLRVA